MEIELFYAVTILYFLKYLIFVPKIITLELQGNVNLPKLSNKLKYIIDFGMLISFSIGLFYTFNNKK